MERSSWILGYVLKVVTLVIFWMWDKGKRSQGCALEFLLEQPGWCFSHLSVHH